MKNSAGFARLRRSDAKSFNGLLGHTAVALLAQSLFLACRSSDGLLDEFGWETPRRGMVVAEHPLAVEVGLGILQRGGNAVDAAVATAAALAVVYPLAGNLGGGGFAVYVPHRGEPAALDFRETAPLKARQDFYLDADGRFVPERSLDSALGAGVPGTPAGLHALAERFGSGRFSFAELMRPAVQLAEDGFPVDPWLAAELRKEEIRAKLSRSSASAAIFYPGGEPLSERDLLIQGDLAQTLVRYGNAGASGFYGGRTSRLLIASLNRAFQRQVPTAAGDQEGSWISQEDLEQYTVHWREPLRGWFRGFEIVTMPPPSSGGVVLLEALAILDGLPLESSLEGEALELSQDESLLHYWIEALRVAFADRAVHLGDPDFHPVPIEQLLAPGRIAAERIAIGPRARPDVAAWAEGPRPPDFETTHLSVLDRFGNAVSLTTTLNSAFGCGLMVEGGGFLLNNELDDFALVAGEPNAFGLIGGAANALAAGKRPLSSMTPVVVREGGRTVRMVLGSPGGSRIITAVFGVLLRTLAFGEELESAVRAPRLHQQWRPVATELEAGWNPLLAEGLRRKGHEILQSEKTWGSVQAIAVKRGDLPFGVSDPRRGGVAGLQGEPVPIPRRPDPPFVPGEEMPSPSLPAARR